MSWFDTLIYPLKWLISWIMVGIHHVLVALGLPAGAGVAWVLAIVGLTLVVRTAIVPLYFKQIMATRAMSVMQPELKALREKYKGRKDAVSQQQQQQEIMALYKRHNASPMASCWPMLVQMPVFIALFRVLASTPQLANGTYMYANLGPLDATYAQQIEDSTFLGAPLSASFMTALNAGQTQTAIVCLVMVVAMAFTMFYTQKHLTMKNMPQTDPNDMQARMMRTMTYTLPIIMGVTGIAFQVGVLIYWLTSNLFMTVQQMYTIHKMPAPGSEAHAKMIKRNNAKYQTFRTAEEDRLDAAYAALGVTGPQVAKAQAAVGAAEVAGDADPRAVLADAERFGNGESAYDADKMWEAVELKRAHDEKLRTQRVKLQLERKEDKDRREAQARAAIENGPREQPKKLTRAQRQREAERARRLAESQRQLDEAELEKKRAQRRDAVQNPSGAKSGKKSGKKKRR